MSDEADAQYTYDTIMEQRDEIERLRAFEDDVREYADTEAVLKGEIARLRALNIELLAALKPMVMHFQIGGSKPIGKMLEDARAAIAKAEGK
jgi:hypothetical protein